MIERLDLLITLEKDTVEQDDTLFTSIGGCFAPFQKQKRKRKSGKTCRATRTRKGKKRSA